MTQHSFTIINQVFPTFRTDLNSALQALASMSLGTAAPTTTFAGMPWNDSLNDLFKVRNDVDTAWITIAKWNYASGWWEPVANTINAASTAGITIKSSGGTTILTISNAGVVTTINDLSVVGNIAVTGTVDGVDVAAEETRLAATSGTNTGDEVLASQAEAEAGTENTKMITSLRAAQAIAALAEGGISAPTDTQTFTTSGTWTKPASGSWVRVRLWSGGGSGGKGSGGGGGGGAYNEIIVPMDMFGATETVTIGSGGAVQTSSDTNGNDGAVSTFGEWLTANFGSAGDSLSSGDAGGDGGGTNIYDPTADVASGGPNETIGTAGIFNQGGGGGGGNNGPGSSKAGGAALDGGGGGGGGGTDVTAGGVSTNGGNGGASAKNADAATAGVQPAGGGGGSETGTSGAGADGKIIVETY